MELKQVYAYSPQAFSIHTFQTLLKRINIAWLLRYQNTLKLERVLPVAIKIDDLQHGCHLHKSHHITKSVDEFGEMYKI